MEHEYPHDNEMERGLLCSLFRDPAQLPIIGDILNEIDVFYNPINGIVFAALVALYREGKDIDILTVESYLRNAQRLEQVGGMDALIGMSHMNQGSYHAISYAKDLLELKAHRTGMNDFIAMTHACESNEPMDMILESCRETMKKLARNDNDIVPYSAIIPVAMAEIKRIHNHKDDSKPVEIMSGFTRLDQVTGGWCPGRLVLLAGKTQDGKSFLAQQWAHQAADEGVSVLFFSLEMQKETIGLRAIEINRKVSLLHHDIRALSDGAIEEIENESNNTTKKLSIYIADRPAIGLYALESKIERFCDKHERAMIIIDYLTLMKGVSGESRRLEVESISRGLKEYSKKYNVPIIAIAQLNRESGREDRAPKLFDLRESGSLEQDSDQCIFLYNPTTKEKEVIFKKYDIAGAVTEEELRMLMLLKNRHGPMIDIPVRCKGFYFTELKYT